jgi:hypothetical protein
MPAPKGNKHAVDNSGGRPTKYKPDYAEQAQKLLLLAAIYGGERRKRPRST